MNKEEFSEKVLELEAMLFHVSYGILRNAQDCEDVVQEAVLKAYTNRDKLKKPDFFKTWLVRILMNECYSFLRKRARELPINEAITEDREAVEDFIREEYLDLYESMKRLEEKDRICVQLFYMEGYSVKEIAKVFRIPEGTVKSRLNRSRARLRESLGENWKDGSY